MPLSPSIITGWLECEHSLTLKVKGARGSDDFGPFADLIRAKGNAHESAVKERYERDGLRVQELPGKEDQTFEEWASHTPPYLEQRDVDVLYQVPLVFQGIKGVADFLLRVTPQPGFSPWEPVDAKLSRTAAKPGHLLQLCFYAEAVTALTGLPPEHIHVELGSGVQETYRYEEFGPYWRRMRHVLGGLVDDSSPVSLATEPEPCNFCDFCDFRAKCEREWRGADSLVYVADLSKMDRRALKTAGVSTLAQLASGTTPSNVLPDQRVERVTLQAALQAQARKHPEAKPPLRHIQPGDDPTWGHGYSLLPRPDAGDIFFDLEGHPFLTPEEGLFFLFGLLLQEEGEWVYQAYWAHDFDTQSQVADDIVELFTQRRHRYPGMHVYHYNHTERSALTAMTAGRPSAVMHFDNEQSGMFIDLHTIVKNSFQIGIERYGLKQLEAVTGYQRVGEINKGAGAVLEYEEFVRDHNPDLLTPIAQYNENDVRSTKVLRDWLIDVRPAGAHWREAFIEPYETDQVLDETIAALLSHAEGTAANILGDVLGYWRRESSAEVTPKFEMARQPVADLIDEPDYLAGIEIQSLDASPSPKKPDSTTYTADVTYPIQELSEKWSDLRPALLIAGREQRTSIGSIAAIDRIARTATIKWTQANGEDPLFPISATQHTFMNSKGKIAAITDAATGLLTNSAPLNPATEQFLLATPPRFLNDGGPADGLFSDDITAMQSWVTNMDNTLVAVQGPPGTGKTYRGSRLVRTLVKAGYRVGVMAPSHSAIDNFLEAVSKHFTEEGEQDLLRVGHKISDKSQQRLPDLITYGTDNPAFKNPDKFNVIGGTSWLFTSKEVRSYGVDVLFIDEAGQVSLADAVAASLCAKNVVLLGDPQQLEQVSHAVHPGAANSTALEHILQGALTITPDRGVFIEETWRMHPEICAFISGQMYESRLRSHPSCALQQVAGHGSGLRYMPVRHEGRSTHAIEEAEVVVAKIRELLGTNWTDQEGNVQPLTVDDFMVVAPFNDQKDLIRGLLNDDPLTAPIAASVGTVDKFQGREAPVVFFSMATSSTEEISRGADFLFSRNRLNVAVSRARCLAYLVCTEELLGTRASKVDDMRLIGTLNAFVESATVLNH
jgi:predicted RecB family nuclease